MKSNAKITKAHLKLTTLIVTWLVICNVIFEQLHIHDAWPAFFISVFFFAYELDTKRLKEIFIGAASGLVLGYSIPIVLGILAPIFGPQIAFNMYLAMVLFFIMATKPIAHTALNSITFAYGTLCLMNITEITDHVVEWGLIMVFGGLLLIGGIIGIVKILAKADQGQAAKK
ncbi:hypothetical protein [Tepidibacter sp. Z1-5]|uniref:hypothetical protein n=1 Tax=Tepidibacter sp. Z1-5 TaxID=3134138 RepID=UPI0030C58AA1